MLDPTPTAARIRKAIQRMIVNYQNAGSYLDLDGNRHRDAEGILNAWNELERMGAPLCPGESERMAGACSNAVRGSARALGINPLWGQVCPSDQYTALVSSMEQHLFNFKDGIISAESFASHAEWHINQLKDLRPHIEKGEWDITRPSSHVAPPACVG